MKRKPKFRRKKRFIDKGFKFKVIRNNAHYPNGISITTWGLEYSFDHRDFQICLPLEKTLSLECFQFLASQIQKGVTFEPDQTYQGYLINGYPIQFIEVVAQEAKMLRIIISDESGGMGTPKFKRQRTKIHDGSYLKAIYYNPQDIGTVKDIAIFMQRLFAAVDYNFHPDASFRNYYFSDSKVKVFTPKQAIQLHKLYEHCLTIKGGKAAVRQAIRIQEQAARKMDQADQAFLAENKPLITPDIIEKKVLHEFSNRPSILYSKKKKDVTSPRKRR